MNPRLLVACVLLLPLAAPGCAVRQDNSGQENEGAFAGDPPQTRDRLSAERMNQLVAGPMSSVQELGLPAGKAAFERLRADTERRYGARSVQVADLYTAFGVGLYTLGQQSDNLRIKAEALPYLQAAIPAYRAAFGPAHPEVALALNSYADLQLVLHEDNPPESAEAALEEACRIRVAALGPGNRETLASLRYLAAARGHPARTRGDRARIEASAGLFRQLLARSTNDARLNYESAPHVHIAFARMYAKNGMTGEARAQLRDAWEQTRRWAVADRCYFVGPKIEEVEEILFGPRTGTRPDTLRRIPRARDCLAASPPIIGNEG